MRVYVCVQGKRGRERRPETRFTTRREARSGPGRGRAIPSLGSAPHSRVPAPLGSTGDMTLHVYICLPVVYVSLPGPPVGYSRRTTYHSTFLLQL